MSERTFRTLTGRPAGGGLDHGYAVWSAIEARMGTLSMPAFGSAEA